MTKWIAVVLALALPAVAIAAGGLKGMSYSMALTGGSAPSADTDGVELTEGSGFTVVGSAESAQTITGGTLLCYYRGCVAWTGANTKTCTTFRWMRCQASLDCTPPTGLRDGPCGDYSTPAGYGRIKYVPNLTASGGTTADVTIVVRSRP